MAHTLPTLHQEESIIVAQLRPSDIKFLWEQIQDVIEHGKDKSPKTKLELMQRIYRLLAKTMPKGKSPKRQ
jgi:ribosomal protein S15P/S13E